MTFEHEGNFYIANLHIYYIAIVNATEPQIGINILIFITPKLNLIFKMYINSVFKDFRGYLFFIQEDLSYNPKIAS